MKLKQGDLFSIRIDDNRNAFGQIIYSTKESLTVIIFKNLIEMTDGFDVDKIVPGNDILFFSNTFDALFHHKRWIVRGNYTENIKSIRLPVYKIGLEPNFTILDFWEKPIRNPEKYDSNHVAYRKYVAPIGIEYAVKAYFNKTDWRPEYDSLLYSNMILE